MNLRKIIFWFHLTCGVLAGTVILIMSFTGVLLTYEQQITNWADRAYATPPHSPDEHRLSWEAMLARVRTQRHADPASIIMRRDPRQPVAFVFGQDTFYADPYSGAVLGQGSEQVRQFFRNVRDWHRWLGRQGESRAAGRAITGACNLAFLLLVMSGFYLWRPRRWRWPNLRNVVWFRRGLRGKARNYNWHNTIGFWCALPLFFIVLSGAVMFYPWANNLIYRITGDVVPTRGAGASAPGCDLSTPARAEACQDRPLPGSPRPAP
jgi:uncharacterized iron-regulated membrane protein